MRRALVFCVVGLCCVWGSTGWAAEWRAGLARTDITPTQPVWMAGYGTRDHPAEGTIHPLWAKALVLEDKQGGRVVIVGTDLIGLSRQIHDAVVGRAAKTTGIEPGRIVLNSSHNHCGPAIVGCALVLNPTDEKFRAPLRAYAKQLEDKLVALIEAACRQMRPVTLEIGQGEATFARNRRGGTIRPVDHSVPVLRVSDPSGRPLAVMFGYACHNTTLGLVYKYNGDYAGFAQLALEQAHPDVMAMFLIGCGADANPSPRGDLAQAEQHGKSLAAAVDRVLKVKMHPISGPLCVASGQVDLPLVDPPSKKELEARRGKGNQYEQRLTEVLLERLAEKNTLDAAYPCPIQVVRFGKDLSLIAIGGEVVVDYAIRLRKEFPGERLWVAGYCNDVFGYLPSERILTEGGYEAGKAMVSYGLHGPFKPGVEKLVVDQVKKLMRECRAP